ncbi:hypothetical protein [Levilactobacillus spicheri]|uniref:Uncharacterized protein n=1 Tax=Levilactobacillus spicheri TaxID=216463 RepID=A0A0F3RQ72_9LACO|nr:hypothetical protein [Levilactobacillus spicheri]KJW11744.1 hypothetical protein VC81_10910 [Levilactobacillus spicheri]
MTKRHHPYQSPNADLLTDQRYAFATRLAGETGLDQSQILFAYLQITATVASGGQTATPTQQREVDRRFQQFLHDAQPE